MAIQIGGKTVIIGSGSQECRNDFAAIFEQQGCTVRLAENGDNVLSLLQQNSAASLILLDAGMPVRDGLDTLCELRRRHNGLPVVVFSENAIPPSVVRMIEEQKAKLLVKPILPEDLYDALDTDGSSGIETSRACRSLLFHRQQPLAPESYTQRAESFVRHVGPTDVPVLLQGETGVGKEVFARQIHASSLRSQNQFVKINCAALPSELVESELFGYERGAFSGAFVQRQGLFETASGGTILLDEIGDMDIRLQPKLLQVLQDGEFRRVGGRELLHVDVRVMAATHQDLGAAIEEGRFREDLYYRLNVVTFHILPLRERREEILPLAKYFLQKYALAGSQPPVIPAVLREAMLRCAWPGNVRELENAMRRYLIVQDPMRLAEELRAPQPRGRSARQAVATSPGIENPVVGEVNGVDALARVEQAKREAEREAVLTALKATHWNRKKAASLLRIDYKALLYKMKKLEIGTNSSVHARPLAVERAKTAAAAI